MVDTSHSDLTGACSDESAVHLYLRKSMSSEYSPLMTPLSFSKASMLMCSFLEFRKSSITLITSASLMPIVSSAVMTTDLWWQLIAGWNTDMREEEMDVWLVKLHKRRKYGSKPEF